MRNPEKIAIWAVTPKGAVLAEKIAKNLPGAALHFSRGLYPRSRDVHTFTRLKTALENDFNLYPAHIFIMSTGIVVRMIAPLIRHKTKDPAVLVIDEKGLHVISLLSGHIGGANALALKVAEWIHSDPVITTATDINRLPAVDNLAREKALFIENPETIKMVSMAMITCKQIYLHDPYGYLTDDLKQIARVVSEQALTDRHAGVFIDDQRVDLPDNILILRPPSLVAGIGCNRDTGFDEIKGFLMDVLARFNLSPKSLNSLASIDLKSDEPGLLALAKDLDLPVRFFTKRELNSVETIQNPSIMVEKHIGVKSVCEAAAILGSNQGSLILPKQHTGNVTVAVARIPFAS